MSTSITKQGILLADGESVGENLVADSYDYSGWYLTPAASWEVTEKNGFQCLHVTGTIGSGKYANPKYTQANATSYKPAPNEIITMSAYVLLENFTPGTTNAYVYFYGSGKTIDGTWRGPTEIARTDKTYVPSWRCFDPEKCKDWTFVFVTYQYGNYDWSGICPNIYARDFSGDFYVRNFKVEIGSTATPWTPAPTDDLYVGDHGFFEGSDTASVAKGYFSSNEFYEI